MNISPDNINFFSENLIVFVSGSNVILYNFETREQQFLLTKSPRRTVTHVSVGTIRNTTNNISNNIQNQKKEKSELLICICEYSDIEELFYITIIKPFSPNIKYTIKSPQQKWKINFSAILNDSPYCITISQKPSTSLKNPILSHITFCKYPLETIVCQETLGSEITYGCFNPKNTLELIICGKGYLRLWNVFINEGTLKEHQHRFLRGKQEKEKTFIKAQFFTRKLFLLIVGTKENMFFIFEGYQLIHELNVCYSFENIYDLNIQNLRKFEEDDDITKLQEKFNSVQKDNLEETMRDISSLLTTNTLKNNESNKETNSKQTETESGSDTNGKSEDKMSETEKKIQKLYKPYGEEEENEKLVKDNGVKYFELINDNLLFVVYLKDGCCMFYKIDWNKKIKDGETEAEFRKWKADENRIIRVARNIKTFHGFSINKITNEILLIAESYEKLVKKGKTYLSLVKFKKSLNKEMKESFYMLNFEYEIFKGFFKKLNVKFIDMWEKKNIILILDKSNELYSFDITENQYNYLYKFPEEVNSISTNPINNYIAISYKNKVAIYTKIKNRCELLTEINVEEGNAKWTFNGKYLIISGRNKIISKKNVKNDSYCLFIVDYLNYNTIKVLENIPNKITKLKIIDDRYLFCLLSDNIISGFFLEVSDFSYTLYETQKKQGEFHKLSNLQFPRIYHYSNINHHYSTFDYDNKLKILISIERIVNKMHLIITKKGKKKIKFEDIEIDNCNLLKIQLVKEIGVLIGADNKGAINIYNWPFKNYDYNHKVNLKENLNSYINLSTSPIRSMIHYKNYHFFITLFNDSIFINELLINKENTYKPFEYFHKRLKPQIEINFPIYSIYDIKQSDLIKKEETTQYLQDGMDKVKNVIEEHFQDVQEAYIIDFQHMEDTIKRSTQNEERKYKDIENDIILLKDKMDKDVKLRLEEIENLKLAREKKNNESLSLYNKEIERLKEDLRNRRKEMEDTYRKEIADQKVNIGQIIASYNDKFAEIKKETDDSLNNLVNLCREYDEASETIVEDYKKLIERYDKKVEETFKKNNELLEERRKILNEEKELEDEHKIKLEEKVKESDKLIEKNIEIKQNLINATQRTITFQEQLIETEKNLLKIDKKLEDLSVKNKHLEQIRFVLEHRMTSLEKEKSPLEGQCNFLENQKNKLTDEFNKIILQINVNNQNLENKQSQLRASLIQNYEAIDQKEYIEEKLDKLKTDLDKFIQEHKNFPENKVSQIALDFRDFYIKYFTNSIEYELIEYKFFSQKLKEQKEKEALLSNMDLIMRNKAEEKLITEKKKVDELRLVKENMFRRLHNENTILINECNRLRKNLHEIYLHVIDIEKRFENLTNIDPNLSKSQIVRQIKDFIKQTHEKIRENYTRNKKQIMLKNTNPINFGNKRYSTPMNLARMRKNKSTNDIKSDYINFNKEKNEEIKQDNSIKEKKEDVNKNNDTENEQKNYYENIIQKPKYIKPNNQSLILKNNKYNINTNISISVKRGRIKLPSIRIKK